VNNTGFLNVYKEKGYTSHDVVAILRKLAGTKKVGHTGTLDPNAQGVLPICLGRATKLADHIMAENKTYVAEVILGMTTDSYDITGEVLSKSTTLVNASKFAHAAAQFVGDIMQVPPMHSAIKINGKKLYELARKGEVVERKPRAVTIHHIYVLSPEQAAAYHCWQSEAHPSLQRFFIKVDCSKGTYIRSLCADIGTVLGCGATMGALTRTRSGIFSLESAKTLDEIRSAASTNDLHNIIMPVAAAFPYPRAKVSPDGLRMATNGNALPNGMITIIENELHVVHENRKKIWLHTPCGDLIGLFGRAPEENTRWCAEVMF